MYFTNKIDCTSIVFINTSNFRSVIILIMIAVQLKSVSTLNNCHQMCVYLHMLVILSNGYIEEYVFYDSHL